MGNTEIQGRFDLITKNHFACNKQFSQHRVWYIIASDIRFLASPPHCYR